MKGPAQSVTYLQVCQVYDDLLRNQITADIASV